MMVLGNTDVYIAGIWNVAWHLYTRILCVDNLQQTISCNFFIFKLARDRGVQWHFAIQQYGHRMPSARCLGRMTMTMTMTTTAVSYVRWRSYDTRAASSYLGGGFYFSVISSRRYTPPALLASLKYAHSPCVLSSSLRCWCWLIFYFFLLFLPFFDFDLDIVCLFHPVFFLGVLCCLLGFGFCCDSFSIWYDILYTMVCILIYT